MERQQAMRSEPIRPISTQTMEKMPMISRPLHHSTHSSAGDVSTGQGKGGGGSRPAKCTHQPRPCAHSGSAVLGGFSKMKA